MTHVQLVAAIALLAGLVVVLVSLRLANKAAGNGYVLTDLLLGDDGKASKAAHVMFGAFFLTSWIMVQLTFTGKLTEGIFMAYCGAWIAPAVTRLIVGPKV